MTSQQEESIASYMYALSIMFEAKVSSRNRIQYQAVIGWDPDQVGERCRVIDAAGCDGVIAIFDPDAIELGPRFIGVSVADGAVVRLKLGSLWADEGGQAALVTRNGTSHLKIVHGRFVERSGAPAKKLVCGQRRARRFLSEVAATRRAMSHTVIVNGQ